MMSIEQRILNDEVKIRIAFTSKFIFIELKLLAIQL